jgi:hypothetical protein
MFCIISNFIKNFGFPLFPIIKEQEEDMYPYIITMYSTQEELDKLV